MRKKLSAFMCIAAACILAMSIALIGCGSGGSSSNNSGGPSSSDNSGTSSTAPADNTVQASSPAEPEDLVVKDAGYVLNDGYIHYAVSIENPNDAYLAEFAHITVTGRTPDGAILFNDDWTVGSIMPGTTTYWATQAGNGDTTEDTSIEFNVSVNDDDWTHTNTQVPGDLYTFDNVTVSEDEWWGLRATGEITLTDASIDVGWVNDVTSPMIVCILKDADGNIVSGFNGYLDTDLSEGAPAVFEIQSYYDIPEYATAEMYANPW